MQDSNLRFPAPKAGDLNQTSLISVKTGALTRICARLSRLQGGYIAAYVLEA